MPAAERAPTPNAPWALNNLPFVIGWPADEPPTMLAGPETDIDPWTAPNGEPWGVLHVVTTLVADEVDGRGGKETTLRRLVATARAHGWPWLPVATARPDSSHHSLGIGVHGIPRATAVELARGAGQTMAFELTAERLRLLDLTSGQITTVRRHHFPRTAAPPWTAATSPVLTVWRERHRRALDPIGAGSNAPATPGAPTRTDAGETDGRGARSAEPSRNERR